MKEKLISLVQYLNDRTAEYNAGHPTISDKEWDDKLFELIRLEKELGYALDNSPTQTINYEVVSQLEKVEHNHKMLSLEKTKDIQEIKDFVGNNDFLAMAKMDGLTCSLKYSNGRLISAETRGNGLVGENILHNAKVISSIPNYIPYEDELVVDGEIICTYKDFNDYSSDYKNPRNFAAGSIRLLDSKECEKRKLTFVAWDVIKGFDFTTSFGDKLELLKTLKFLIVPYVKNNIDTTKIVDICQDLSYPIDGLVYKFDNVIYGRSLGETTHHLKNAMAFKFYDETYPTFLKEIEWSIGRTGQLTPVAIFEPVDMDGSEVSRASLHNVSVMEELFHGSPFIGQKIEVFKSNMIIPQVYSTEEPRDSIYVKNMEEIPFIEYPNFCPVCGKHTTIVENDGVKVLVCLNPDCEGKLINKLDHFCGKKGLDIKGLSKATLEKLIDWGWVNNISDIMILRHHRDEWIQKPSFGQKSVDKILNAIEDAQTTTLEMFISSLGISLIGQTFSKDLVKHIKSYEEFREKAKNHFDFSVYEGFAESKTTSIWNYDFTEADKVYPFLSFEEKKDIENLESNCENIKVVITGKLQYFKNRDALKEKIEANGGKVVDTVSKTTTYLINNDMSSNSSKNISAKKLGIPIISEKEFLEKFNLN